MLGLGRNQWSADRDRWAVFESGNGNLNNAAWRIASRQPYADGGLALQCTHMLLAITEGGAWLDLNTMDTVAACLARGGDFANAVRIEQEAMDGLPPLWPDQLADFGKRLALYQAHQVANEPRQANEPVGELVEAKLTWPGGQPRAVGHTCNGARLGTWRFFSAAGSLEATCSYWEGVVDGPARSYFPDGTLSAEAFFCDWGERIGRWRCWHPSGMLACDGTYIHNGRSPQKCGEWQWFDPGGRGRESGEYFYDQRIGPWSAWDLAGRRICHSTFSSGTPQREDWTLKDEVLAEPASPEPVPATA